MSERYCRACGGWHNTDAPWPAKCVGHFQAHLGKAVSSLPRPYIQSDNIEVQSMADGKMYTSKSRLRRTYRDGGYEEYGNDMPAVETPKKIGGLKDDLHRAIAQVKEGYKPHIDETPFTEL